MGVISSRAKAILCLFSKYLPESMDGMRASIGNAVSRYKLLLALTAGVFLLAIPSGAVHLGAIHLPGRIASHAEVGLAVSAPDTLYAAYWIRGEHDRLWQLLVYKFNSTTGKVLAESELDKAEPLRFWGHVISWVKLSISPDGSMLLCTTDESGPVRKAWTLSSRDLHVLSRRTILLDANLFEFAQPNLFEFAQTGGVRLLRTQKAAKFGQEVNSVTVFDLNARSLDKNVFERVVEFQEPVWARLIAVGTGDLLWAVDERASPEGAARIRAYNLQNGKSVVTREVSLAEAQVGAPASPHLRRRDLMPQPGISPDAPRLGQIVPVGQAVLVVINEPATDPLAWSRVVQWSRVMRLGVSSTQAAMSSILTGCDLGLETVGRSGRIVAGSCYVWGHVLFWPAIKKSEAVFVSTRTGSVAAVVPFRGPPLSLAIDDSVQPAIVALYDQRATVRLLSVP